MAGIHIPVNLFHIYMSEGMCSLSNTRYVCMLKSSGIWHWSGLPREVPPNPSTRVHLVAS